jgi:uncharacterized RDD family membrane protein YckC
MYCSNCGASNIGTAAFCANCGEALSRRGGASPPGQLLAGRGARLVAKIIDFAIPLIGAIVIVIFFVFNIFLGVISLLVLLSIPVVQVVMLSLSGQTIGKRALGIRIVKVDTGQNGGFVPNVVLRAWLIYLLGVVPILGTIFWLVDIFLIFRQDKRCIHDLIAGTRVIQ